MCGRFTQTKPIEKVAKTFEAVNTVKSQNVGARYNVAPSQEILIVTTNEKENRKELSLIIWGLIPFWSKDGHGFINAKAETLIEKPSFRESFKKRRCLIPATGFYEWAQKGKSKEPHYFNLKDSGLFAFAGLWDEWSSGKGQVKTCAIITTEPNDLVKPVHNRMPVILDPKGYDAWLDNATPVDKLKEWLLPYPAEYMKSYPVSTAVNSPSVDVPDLIKHVD